MPDRLDQIISTLSAVELTTNRIARVIDGNGQPGLIQRVTTLEAKQPKSFSIPPAKRRSAAIVVAWITAGGLVVAALIATLPTIF